MGCPHPPAGWEEWNSQTGQKGEDASYCANLSPDSTPLSNPFTILPPLFNSPSLIQTYSCLKLDALFSSTRLHLQRHPRLPPTPHRSFARSPQCQLASDLFNLKQGVTPSLVAPSASHSPPNTIVGVSPRAIGCPGTSPPALYVQSNLHGIHSKETSRERNKTPWAVSPNPP